MKTEDIVAAAKAEIREENRRAAIEAEKARLRARQGKSLWQRLLDKLPFTIHFKRKAS